MIKVWHIVTHERKLITRRRSMLSGWNSTRTQYVYMDQ